MTNSNTVAPTGRPPNEPRPAYIVTNRSPVDRAIWTALALLAVFVLGTLVGASHQQSVFEDAVEKARQQHKPALGAPATLRVSYNGWVAKELPPLTENPNCVLYQDPCPFDLPTPPEGQPEPSTQQESSWSGTQLA